MKINYKDISQIYDSYDVIIVLSERNTGKTFNSLKYIYNDAILNSNSSYSIITNKVAELREHYYKLRSIIDDVMVKKISNEKIVLKNNSSFNFYTYKSIQSDIYILDYIDYNHKNLQYLYNNLGSSKKIIINDDYDRYMENGHKQFNFSNKKVKYITNSDILQILREMKISKIIGNL